MDAPEPGNLAPDPLLDRARLKGGRRWREQLQWRWNRLRCMSPLEVAHRVVRAGQAAAERAGAVPAPAAPTPDLRAAAPTWLRADASVAAAPYLRFADGVVAGRLDVFALREAEIGSPPRWNRDPKTGIEAPLAFGKHLDYRDADRVGDIKYLWEPNRHMHLVTLAQAWVLTGRRLYADALVEHLDSWFLACPYGRGPNWSSALEAALRLVNWSHAWQLIGGARSEFFVRNNLLDFRGRWLRSVYEHAEFIRRWPSAHSSANNHLIGEATGLFVAGVTWPHWPAARRWAGQGQRILEREALAQNAPDGVNREQATWYQQFVLDMLVQGLLAGKAGGRWFGADYESRVEAMLDFIASIMDAGGRVPMIGDADDGLTTHLEPGRDPFRSLLAIGALLFKRGDFKLKAGRLDDSARWLFGPEADEQWDALDPEKTRLPHRQAFPQGGYYVLGCDLDTPREVRLVADAGPLGYRSIAAHGHADALSFTLSAGGREILVDPGTFAYHTQPQWRQYFRGTSAHNTLRVDGADQSVQGGNFMWLAKARAGCSLWLSSNEKDRFEGWHDGYARLEDPVKHRRLIELDKLARRIIVEDSLEMLGEHDIEVFFHCAEDVSPEPVPGGYSLGGLATLLLPPAGEARVARGSTSPILGWVSRSFDRRQPASTIVWSARISGPTVLRTEILINP